MAISVLGGAGSITRRRRQEFPASGTLTVPAGVTSMLVRAIGAGGSGEASMGEAMGGGGGGQVDQFIDVVPGQSLTVTIGAGGATVQNSTANNFVPGNDGAASTVTSSSPTVSVTAPGGKAGGTAGQGAPGNNLGGTGCGRYSTTNTALGANVAPVATAGRGGNSDGGGGGGLQNSVPAVYPAGPSGGRGAGNLGQSATVTMYASAGKPNTGGGGGGCGGYSNQTSGGTITSVSGAGGSGFVVIEWEEAA